MAEINFRDNCFHNRSHLLNSNGVQHSTAFEINTVSLQNLRHCFIIRIKKLPLRKLLLIVTLQSHRS